MEAKEFTVTSTISFRPYRVPPRCRKPRQVEESFTHDFTIPCVASEDAPVVALVPDAPLRAYAGDLYAGWNRGRQPVLAGSDAFPATHTYETWESWDSEAVRAAGRAFTDLIIIDGQLWKKTKEPAYSIITMGLGGGHGGTYLEIDYQGRYARQFPLTDYDAAVEAAVAFAEKRGDTNTIPTIRKTPKATIFDPSAFKVPTEAEVLASAHAEIQALAKQACDLLSGKLTRSGLGTVKDLADKASSVFWQHDIDESPAP